MSMTIDLSTEIEDQFTRVKRLAEEAEDEDSGESLSNRAAAMRPLTQMLITLEELQTKVKNNKEQAAIEQALIDVVRKSLNPKQYDVFLKDVEARLSEVD